MWHNLKKYHYDFLWILLIVILPFSPAIPTIILGLLFISFLLQIKTVDFCKLKNSILISLGLLITFLLLKSVFIGTILSDFSLYSRFLFVLLIPILAIKISDINKIKVAFIISTTCMILLSIYKITQFYLAFKYILLGNGHAANAILVLERPYTGFMAVIGIVLCFDQILKKNALKHAYSILLLFMLGFILFISARNSIVTIMLLVIIYLLFYSGLSKKVKGSLLAGIFSIILLAFVFNGHLTERFHLGNSISESIANMKALEPRFIIWDCVSKVLEFSDYKILTGFASEDIANQYLVNCYEASISDNVYKQGWFLTEKFNTHNQFFGFLLIGGSIGAILFLAFVINMIKHGYTNFTNAAIVLALILFFLFENVLYRQLGCYFVGIILAIILFQNKQTIQNPQVQ